jgi:hypothetical protein
MTVESVKLITEMYMEVVERLAAVSDRKHPEALGRLHAFLQRHDVQAVLQTPQPEAPPPRTSSSKSLLEGFSSILKKARVVLA